MKITLINRAFLHESKVGVFTDPPITEEIFKQFLSLRKGNPILEQVAFGRKERMLLVNFGSGSPNFEGELSESIQDALDKAEKEIVCRQNEAREKQKAEADAETTRREQIIQNAARAFKVDIVNDDLHRERNFDEL